jgi:hypothetical protein
LENHRYRSGNASPVAMNGNEQRFAARRVVTNAQDHFEHDSDG